MATVFSENKPTLVASTVYTILSSYHGNGILKNKPTLVASTVYTILRSYHGNGILKTNPPWWHRAVPAPPSESCPSCPCAAGFPLHSAAHFCEREREMFYLTTHSTHFIYGYMASDIRLRIVRKETLLLPHNLID